MAMLVARNVGLGSIARSSCAPGLSGFRRLADIHCVSRHVANVPKPEIFNGPDHVPLAQWMSAVRSGYRGPTLFARTKHLVTCRSQYSMHLF
jgi:hypothetical protein